MKNHPASILFVINVLTHLGIYDTWPEWYLSPHDSCLCYAMVLSEQGLSDLRERLEHREYTITQLDYTYPMRVSISKP